MTSVAPRFPRAQSRVSDAPSRRVEATMTFPIRLSDAFVPIEPVPSVTGR